jgi:hypothetical protein
MFNKTKQFIALTLLMGISIPLMAQSGANGLSTAFSTIHSFIDPIVSITLAIGGIVGIVGAVRVYSKWNAGDQDINKELMGWGGSCVFLVISALVIKAFFGL